MMASHYRDHGPLDCKVYVGDLGSGAAKHEIERAFSSYGPISNVWVARNPPGFAFVEFNDSRDAYDAVRGLDGKYLCGRRVRVEMSSGKARRSRSRDDRGPRYGGSVGRYGRSKYSHSRSRSRSPRRYKSRSRSPRRRSPARRRTRSYSRSRSRTRSRSRDRVRSRSRSPRYDRSRSRSRSPADRNDHNGDARSSPRKDSPRPDDE